MVVHAKGSTPGSAESDEPSLLDPMAKLMGDWSWRPEMQPVDPGYVYTYGERVWWQMHNECGVQAPAVRPWMARAYRGPIQPPKRIGG